MERLREEHRLQIEELQSLVDEKSHVADEYIKVNEQLHRQYSAKLEELDRMTNCSIHQNETNMNSHPQITSRSVSPHNLAESTSLPCTSKHSTTKHKRKEAATMTMNTERHPVISLHNIQLPELEIHRCMSSPPVLGIKSITQNRLPYESMHVVDLKSKIDEDTIEHDFRTHMSIDELGRCDNCRRYFESPKLEVLNKISTTSTNSIADIEDKLSHSLRSSVGPKIAHQNYGSIIYENSNDSTHIDMQFESPLRRWLGSIFTIAVASLLGINHANISVS
jgi:hypothetical protein